MEAMLTIKSFLIGGRIKVFVLLGLVIMHILVYLPHFLRTLILILDDGATKGQIKSAFIKSLKTKKLNKKVLGEFISLVV